MKTIEQREYYVMVIVYWRNTDEIYIVMIEIYQYWLTALVMNSFYEKQIF